MTHHIKRFYQVSHYRLSPHSVGSPFWSFGTGLVFVSRVRVNLTFAKDGDLGLEEVVDVGNERRKWNRGIFDQLKLLEHSLSLWHPRNSQYHPPTHTIARQTSSRNKD